MKLGDNIKKYRNLKKITQKQLGDNINKSVRMIQKYEANEVTPSLEVIDDIAKALDVERWDLIVGSKEGKTRKEYREEAINNMIDDFIEFSKRFGFNIFKHFDNKYIISSLESENELMITKDELLEMRENVMAYTKFTLDFSFEKLNDDEHQSPLEDVMIVEEEDTQER